MKIGLDNTQYHVLYLFRPGATATIRPDIGADPVDLDAANAGRPRGRRTGLPCPTPAFCHARSTASGPFVVPIFRPSARRSIVEIGRSCQRTLLYLLQHPAGQARAAA